ncbi:hypothetical protein ACS0PU_001014 [Formica fusca]
MSLLRFIAFAFKIKITSQNLIISISSQPREKKPFEWRKNLNAMGYIYPPRCGSLSFSLFLFLACRATTVRFKRKSLSTEPRQRELAREKKKQRLRAAILARQKTGRAFAVRLRRIS